MGSMDPKTGMMYKEKDMPMKAEEMGGDKNKGKTEMQSGSSSKQGSMSSGTAQKHW